jgi:hypothetical protein
MNPLDLIPPTQRQASAAIRGAPANVGPAVVKLSPFGDSPAPQIVPAKVSPFGDAPASQEDAQRHYTVAGIPIPDQVGQPLEQVAAGLNRTIDQVIGLPEWAVRSALNAPKAVENISQGKDLGEGMIQPGMFSAENIGRQLDKLGVTDPDKVKAKTLSDHLLQAFGEGAGAMAAPEMFFPKLIAAFKESGVIGEQAAAMAKALVGEGSSLPQIAKDAIIAGAANATGEGAAENVPDEWKPLVHTLAGLGGAITVAGVAEAVPAVVKGGAKLASDIVAPLTEGGRQRLAGEQLTNAASDPAAAKTALRNAPEDENLTTGPSSGDMGLLGKERAVATDNPVEYNAKLAEQNAARVDSVQSLQAKGSPESVTTALRSHLADIDRQANDAVEAARTSAEADVASARQSAETGTQAAQDTARAKAEGIGQGVEPDVAGEAIRTKYESARAAAKDQERSLWGAVDPEGKLRLGTSEAKAAQSKIFDEIPTTAKAQEGEEAAIFETVKALPDNAPFSDITALQGRIKAAMREERFKSGESPAYRRLVQLNEGVQRDIEGAVAEKVAQEQKAVAAGQMSAADTIASRFQAYADSHLAQSEASPVARGGNSPPAVSGEASIPNPPQGGANGKPLSRPADGGGDPGVSSEKFQSNLDKAALDRLKTARAATKERVETFDNKTLAPIRKRPATTSPYDMPASAVPQKIFYPRPASREAIAQLRKAVGDTEALSTLEPYAIGKLHRVALEGDGTLNASKAEAWLRSHHDALEAFPELADRVRAAAESSKALTEAQANAKRSVTAAERAAKDKTAEAERTAKAKKDEERSGAIGKIVEADDPEEVVRKVGQVFGRPDAAKEMARIRRATHGDKDAQEGLRKGIVDFITKKFVGNNEAGTSGVGTIKSDGFQNFVREHSSTLRAAGFTADEVLRMQAVAAELRKANRAVTAVKLKGGSNTPQDLIAKAKGSKSLFELLAAFGLLGESVNVFHGAGWGVAAGLAGAVTAAVRRSGLNKVDQLVKEAILDPKLALKLMEKVKPEQAPRAARGLIETLAPSNILGVVADPSR